MWLFYFSDFYREKIFMECENINCDRPILLNVKMKIPLSIQNQDFMFYNGQDRVDTHIGGFVGGMGGGGSSTQVNREK